MSENRGSQQPIGYWLKRADEALTRRIDEAQSANGLSRLEWQVLNHVQEEGSTTQEQLAAALRPFADEIGVAETLERLGGRGLIEGLGPSLETYRLTQSGRPLHEQALASQKEVRRRAMEGLSEADYTTTVLTLQRIVANLDKEALP